MKQLIFINGPMGVGKSTVCQTLYQRLPDSVWLDGDWCWMMYPFRVNDENKQMVEDNITHLLGNFLRNSSLQYVIFSWVMHQESIAQQLLFHLQGKYQFDLMRVSLVCSPEVLQARLAVRGTPQVLTSALSRLPLYQQQDSWCLDSSDLSAEQVADLIVTHLGR